MVNKNDTFEKQANQGRRPRLNWKDLEKQIKNELKIVFSGNINEILHQID